MTTIECQSRIERVVLYARGAVVSRALLLPDELPEGPVELRVPRVSALAEAGSLRAQVDGEREVISIRAELCVPAGAARPGRLFEAVRAKRFERERLEAERAQLAALRAALAGATLDPRLSRWASRPKAAERFADALALGELIAGELARLDRAQLELDLALEETQRALAALELDAAQGSTAELAGEQRPHLEVALRLGPARSEERGEARASLRAIAIDYVVGAARWWPAYSARFSAAATKVRFAIEAFVAQASGEDWSGVAIALSTADLAQDLRLPELRSLRIGRAQPPVRKGYRPPPVGLDAMFEGYDRCAFVPAPPPSAPPKADIGALLDATLEQAKGMAPPLAAMPFGAPPGGPPPPRPGPIMPQSVTRSKAAVMPPMQHAAAPSAPRSVVAADDTQEMTRAGSARRPAPEGAVRQRLESLAEAPFQGEGAGGAVMQEAMPPEPGEAFLDFDALTLPDPADRARRGRLAPADRRAGLREIAAARAAIEALAGPRDASDPLEIRGRFDHRYDAEGLADVASNGQAQRVSISAAEAESRPRFVTAPREAAEVYREAELHNPFSSPLLSGPVEVFFEGALLTTGTLRTVDRKGVIRLGLGVEERLRVARNVRAEEGSAGLLGGSTTMDHNVTIELSSSLGQKVTVVVLDRVPVSDEKDVDVKVLHQRPEAVPYTQAERGEPLRRGLSWSIELAPGGKQRIDLGYRLTFPSKHEIIGGNRRE
jgi:hypothetical protein